MTRDKAKAKIAIQQIAHKKAKKGAPSNAVAVEAAASVGRDRPSEVKASASHTSLGDALLRAPALVATNVQQHSSHGATRQPPLNIDTSVASSAQAMSLGGQGPQDSLAMSLGGQGPQDSLVSSLTPAGFPNAYENQVQLALLKRPGVNPFTTEAGRETTGVGGDNVSLGLASVTGGDDSRAFLRALLSQQETYELQAQHLQENNQKQEQEAICNLPLHHDSAQSYMLNQSALLQQQLQQQDALLLQLEAERQQRQGQQRQMQSVPQYLTQPNQQQSQMEPDQDTGLHRMIQQQELQLLQLQQNLELQERQRQNQERINNQMRQHQEMKQQSPQQIFQQPEFQPNDIVGLTALEPNGDLPGNAGESAVFGGVVGPDALSSMQDQSILQQLFLRKQQQQNGSQNQGSSGSRG